MPLRIQTHTHTHLLGIDHLVTLLVNYWQTTVKTKSKEVLLLGTEKAGKNERPSAIVFHKGQMQFNPIIWRDGGGGGGATSATACASGVRNRKGPFNRTVAPCEPSTFVKGEG